MSAAHITSVWSSYGHRFMSTDCEDHEACLTCGAMYQLVPLADDPTRGEYTTASGDEPADCTHDTMMVHAYSGEAWCDSCDNADGGCSHCVHDCPCIACDS